MYMKKKTSFDEGFEMGAEVGTQKALEFLLDDAPLSVILLVQGFLLEEIFNEE